MLLWWYIHDTKLYTNKLQDGHSNLQQKSDRNLMLLWWYIHDTKLYTYKLQDGHSNSHEYLTHISNNTTKL